MSEIKYGLISESDARCLQKTIDLILSDTTDKYINVLEIGCYGGGTAMGIAEYIFSKHRIPVITGIDNNKNGEEIKFKYDKLIIGNSSEVYNQIPDDSQHLIFQDACHCKDCVIESFHLYASKVKVGGFMAWHDTGKHISIFKDYQHGDKNNPDSYISVRKALRILRMIPNEIETKYENTFIYIEGNWELIFDEADENDLAGGVTVFRKL